MLILLFALGSGAASFLGTRFDAAARLAMAPVFGLCLGTCLFTTLIWFTAARNTYWLLLILALISLGVALMRALRALRADSGDGGSWHSRLRRRLPLRDVVGLAVVCVVVAAPMSYTLHERHSVGPMGFSVWDTVGYTAVTDGMTQQSLRTAAGHDYTTARSFIQRYWEFTAAGEQNIDAAPLSANFNELIGLHSTDTQSLFLIVFLLAGALGAFAAVRYAAPRPGWAAPLAGVLFAGPFFLQLMADGSQAATCGLGLILPIAAMGLDVLRGPRLANMALLALLAAGLMALYPMFVPGIALSGVIVLLVVGGMAWWRGQLTGRGLARAAAQVGIVLSLAILLDLVAFTRDLRYWHNVLHGAYYIPSLPKYHLPYSVLPGWLLQTREFYSLTELGSTSAKEVFIGVLLPAALIAVIVFGLRRLRAALILLPSIAVYVALADYTSASHNCSYCTDRALLPVAPLSIGLLVLGIAALATASSWRLRWIGVGVAVLAVIAVGERTHAERVRFANGSYFLDAGERALLASLPSHTGSVAMEGYGEGPGTAPGELPLVYFLLSEHNGGLVSIPTESEDYASLAYVGGPNAANPELDTQYRYVLTRLGGVETGRRTIARTGPLALEERRGSMDATIVSGLGVPYVRLDGQGLPWVEGPLRLVLIGGDSAPAWILLRLRHIVPVHVPRQRGVSARFLPSGDLAVCVRANGVAPVRRGSLTLEFGKLPGLIPGEPFAVPEPPQGVQLTAMRAASKCSLG